MKKVISMEKQSHFANLGVIPMYMSLSCNLRVEM